MCGVMWEKGCFGSEQKVISTVATPANAPPFPQPMLVAARRHCWRLLPRPALLAATTARPTSAARPVRRAAASVQPMAAAAPSAAGLRSYL